MENNEETVMAFTESYRNIGVVAQYSHIRIGKNQISITIHRFSRAAATHNTVQRSTSYS